MKQGVDPLIICLSLQRTFLYNAAPLTNMEDDQRRKDPSLLVSDDYGSKAA